MSCPVVSVIIPVYNVAPYLQEALDSVVNQTYKNLEIIVVDDGSTDGSGEICDEYASRDPRINVIHQSNCGPSNARNTGLDLAAGDFIAFLDADDAYHPEFIQRMLNVIENADVVECSVMKYQLTLDSKGWIEFAVKEGSFDRENALHGLVYGKFFLAAWNKLYRKELWDEIRFPEGRFYEDMEVIYYVFNRISQLYSLDQPLYIYRQRMSSTTQTFTRKMAEDFKLAYDHIISFVKNHSPEVFSETDLYKVLISRMGAMIKFYAKGAADIRDLRATCEGIDPKKLSLRDKVKYHIIRSCPWTLKVFYPVYHPLRMMILRAFGR